MVNRFKRIASTAFRAKWCVLALWVVVVGCGDGRPMRVPVSGRVLIDGKPLDCGEKGAGFIRFVAEEGRPAGSPIGRDGRFTLNCYGNNDGALLGRHAVEILALEPITTNTARYYVPEKYARVQTSGLVVEITGPTDDLVVELTWGGGEPFVKRINGE